MVSERALIDGKDGCFVLHNNFALIFFFFLMFSVEFLIQHSHFLSFSFIYILMEL